MKQIRDLIHKKINLCAIILIAVAAVGCNRGNNRQNINEEKLIHIDVSEWEKNKTIPDGLLKSVGFLPLETTDSCLIGNIDKLLVNESRIYALDKKYTKKIFVFNKEGSFIRSIGKPGRGPGECLGTDDFIADEKGNRLFVLDIHQRKVLIFDLTSGNYINEFKLDFLPNNFALLNEDTLVFYCKGYEEYSIAFFDIRDKSCKWFLKRDEYDSRLSSLFSIYQSENIYYAPFLKDVVYKVTEDSIIPALTFNFGNDKVPGDKLKACINNPQNIINVMMEGNWTHGITNVLENNDHIVFTINLRGSYMNVLYHKSTGNYYYGNKFNGTSRIFGRMNKLAVYNNKFIGSIDAGLYKKLKNGILEQNNADLKEAYLKTFEVISRDSNPVIVSIELKNF